MQRRTQFAFRVTNEERRAIADLATQLKRSQSDAVRFVVTEAARQLSDPPALPTKTAQDLQGGHYVTN